jgi:hypothetical protein
VFNPLAAVGELKRRDEQQLPDLGAESVVIFLLAPADQIFFLIILRDKFDLKRLNRGRVGILPSEK